MCTQNLWETFSWKLRKKGERESGKSRGDRKGENQGENRKHRKVTSAEKSLSQMSYRSIRVKVNLNQQMYSRYFVFS